MSNPQLISIEQSDQAAAALSKLSALLNVMNNALFAGEQINPSDFSALFTYSLAELDVLKTIFKELDSARIEGRVA